MNDKKWVEKLTFEDLPNSDMKLIADLCGLDVATRLMTELPGLSINIPKEGLRKLKNRYIADQYDGSNAKQLAVECGVSIRHIYNLARKKRSEINL